MADGILISLDPSLRSCGVALWIGGELRQVACVKTSSEGSIAKRALAMALKVDDTIERWLGMSSAGFVLASEWPQIYAGVKSKADPNDQIGMAGVVGAVAGRCRVFDVRGYLPAEWEPAPKVSPERRKRRLGPLDSEAFSSPRGLRVMGRLSDAERALVPMSHDAVDSVGIGLFHLGRLAPRRVFAGAVEG